MEKIIITTFTDPMMGLTYETEPVYDRLREQFGDQLELRFVMAGLVRDVEDFMTPAEKALGAEQGIAGQWDPGLRFIPAADRGRGERLNKAKFPQLNKKRSLIPRRRNAEKSAVFFSGNKAMLLRECSRSHLEVL